MKGITKQRNQFMVEFLQKLDQSAIKKNKEYSTGTSISHIASEFLNNDVAVQPTRWRKSPSND